MLADILCQIVPFHLNDTPFAVYVSFVDGLFGKSNAAIIYFLIIYGVPELSAINFAFHAFLTDVVHTAVQTAFISSVISVVPSGSLSSGLSTRLSDSSSVPGSDTNLSKDLVSYVPSFLMTVAFLTCTCLYVPTTSILSYSIDSESAIREIPPN